MVRHRSREGVSVVATEQESGEQELAERGGKLIERELYGKTKQELDDWVQRIGAKKVLKMLAERAYKATTVTKRITFQGRQDLYAMGYIIERHLPDTHEAQKAAS